jgi:hypothetical protein
MRYDGLLLNDTLDPAGPRERVTWVYLLRRAGDSLRGLRSWQIICNCRYQSIPRIER